MDHKLLQSLNSQSREAALRDLRALSVDDPEVRLDPQKLWMAESISHLAHAPFFSDFSLQERLTYNHLFTLTTLEQFIFFEARVSPRILPENFASQDLEFSPDHEEALRIFDSEEREHVRMFTAFLEKARTLYPRQQIFSLGLGIDRALDFIFRWPRFFVFWCWALIYIEERTTIISRRMKKDEGRMDPTALELHLRHLKDEMRHLVLSEEMIRTYWDPAPRWVQGLNLWLLGQFMNVVFYRSYSATATWKRLLEIHPRLKIHQKAFTTYIASLPHNAVYLSQMFSQESCPRFWASLQARPETRSFREDLIRRTQRH